MSSAVNSQDNSLMELFVWHPDSVRPVMKLLLPMFECSRMTFDESGEVLLLLKKDEVVRSLLMDPDCWIERGQRMSRLEWSKQRT